MPIFWTGVSSFSVTLFYFTLFCCGRKANLVWFTLFYSTLLTLTDGQTDRQTDRGMNTLALRGLVEPFFQLCCCISFLFWQEIGFGFTYYYVLRVSYSCGVDSFWCYVHTWSTIQLCGCAIFFVVAGKLILYEFSCSIPIFFFFGSGGK